MAKKKTDDIVMDTPDDFVNWATENYKKEGQFFGVVKTASNIPRFSSQSLSLDLAMGGGFPFGRITLIVGYESTGKTAIALKACESIKEYDHVTKKHVSLVENPTPGRALYISYEPFDSMWSERLGFDLGHHTVIIPDTSQQGIDLVSRAIESNVFDLIVIDALSVMSHSNELNGSTEDWDMGTNARLLNRAFRQWLTKLNQAILSSNYGPAVICLNHFRTKLDTGPFVKDKRETPGGKGQLAAASVIVHTGKIKYTNEEKEASLATISGVIAKNKTYIPKKEFSFDMAIKDTDKYLTGEIISTKTLFDFGIKHKLITSSPGKCEFNGSNYKTQKELRDELDNNRDLRALLWRSIIKLELE